MARTISVVKWESEQDVDNAVGDIKGEMERLGGLTKDTERAMQHFFRKGNLIAFWNFSVNEFI